MTNVMWRGFGAALVSCLALAACGGGSDSQSQVTAHLGVEAYAVPQQVSTSLTFVTLESSEQHVCGSAADGSLWCWGSNGHGELATGTGMEACGNGPCTGDPHKSNSSLAFVSLATALGAGSTCGLVASGEAYCWGSIANPGGQLASQPSPVAGGVNFVRLRLSLDGAGACGLTAGGVMYCWGAVGLLYGNGQKSESHALPTAVQTNLTFVDFDLGQFHACAVTAGGQTYCWGDNWFGQLGQGSAGGAKNGGLAQASSPLLVNGLPAVAAVVTSSEVSCALAVSGAAYCWGSGSATGVTAITGYGGTPAAVQGGVRFGTLSAGFLDVCGLTVDGDAYCWGDNRVGELGDGSLVDSQVPVKVNTPVPLKSLSHRGACGIGADSLAYCWGLNAYGEVGRPPFDVPAPPGT